VLRRTARAAHAALAARSPQFARHGCPYELPPQPEVVSPSQIVEQLDPGRGGPTVRFDSEGRWRLDSSAN
jgi:hypothetical protein